MHNTWSGRKLRISVRLVRWVLDSNDDWRWETLETCASCGMMVEMREIPIIMTLWHACHQDNVTWMLPSMLWVQKIALTIIPLWPELSVENFRPCSVLNWTTHWTHYWTKDMQKTCVSIVAALLHLLHWVSAPKSFHGAAISWVHCWVFFCNQVQIRLCCHFDFLLIFFGRSQLSAALYQLWGRLQCYCFFERIVGDLFFLPTQQHWALPQFLHHWTSFILLSSVLLWSRKWWRWVLISIL